MKVALVLYTCTCRCVYVHKYLTAVKKMLSHLCNFRMINTIKFLFSTHHTEPFLHGHGIKYFGGGGGGEEVIY